MCCLSVQRQRPSSPCEGNPNTYSLYDSGGLYTYNSQTKRLQQQCCNRLACPTKPQTCSYSMGFGKFSRQSMRVVNKEQKCPNPIESKLWNGSRSVSSRCRTTVLPYQGKGFASYLGNEQTTDGEKRGRRDRGGWKSNMLPKRRQLIKFSVLVLHESGSPCSNKCAFPKIQMT